MIPNLQSDQITLKPLTEADRNLSHSLYSNEQVTSGFNRPPLSGQALDDKFNQLLCSWAVDGFSQFTIIDNKTQEQAGLGGIRPTGGEGQGEVGYVLLPSAWGRGLASEAVRLWTIWAFEDLGLKRIVADGVENPASIRVLVKSGYTIYDEQTVGRRKLFSLEIVQENYLKNESIKD